MEDTFKLHLIVTRPDGHAMDVRHEISLFEVEQARIGGPAVIAKLMAQMVEGLTMAMHAKGFV